jgi:hypothetical protein
MKRNILHTICVLSFAVLIYVLFRSKTITVLGLKNYPYIYSIMKDLQLYCKPLKSALPEWFIYSLPDGLWTYAFTSYAVIRLRNDPTSSFKTFYLLFTPVLSISLEISQKFHLFPGTFDFVDLFFDFLGSILPFIFFYRAAFKDIIPSSFKRFIPEGINML